MKCLAVLTAFACIGLASSFPAPQDASSMPGMPSAAAPSATSPGSSVRGANSTGPSMSSLDNSTFSDWSRTNNTDLPPMNQTGLANMTLADGPPEALNGTDGQLPTGSSTADSPAPTGEETD